MHDPLVVAFEIRRPWPQRSPLPAAGRPSTRWRIRLHHDCGTWCVDDPAHRGGAFPWWRSSSYSAFWRLNGRDYYFPSMVTVWHREPGGRDALSGCGKRVQRSNGTWGFSRGWRWHIHHWKIQVPPFQHLRRHLLTRCSWCGGRSVKGDQVNHSHQWNGSRGHWWRGEPGLFHSDCSSIQRAHSTCVCVRPAPESGSYGHCALCGLFRPYGITDANLARVRDLQSIPPAGRRDSAKEAPDA